MLAEKQQELSNVPKILSSLLFFMIVLKPEWLISALHPFRSTILILYVLLLGLILMSPGRYIGSWTPKYLLLFLFLVIFSGITARNTGQARGAVITYGLNMIAVISMVVFINEFKDYKKLISIIFFSGCIIAILGILNHGKVPANPYLQDENDFSLMLNWIFPFCYFSIFQTKRNKLTALGLMVLILTANILSISRGGFLGLLATGAYCYIRSKKRAAATILFLFLIAMFITITTPKFWNEISTIWKLKSSSPTAVSRIFYWTVAIRQFIDHPILGVGPRNFGVWLPDYVRPHDPFDMFDRYHIRWGEVCHSVYLTVLAELGLVGIILFLVIIYKFLKENRTIQNTASYYSMHEKTKAEFEHIYQFSIAQEAALIGFLTSGIFLSVLYYPWFWLLLGLSATLMNGLNRLITTNNLMDNAELGKNTLQTSKILNTQNDKLERI